MKLFQVACPTGDSHGVLDLLSFCGQMLLKFLSKKESKSTVDKNKENVRSSGGLSHVQKRLTLEEPPDLGGLEHAAPGGLKARLIEVIGNLSIVLAGLLHHLGHRQRPAVGWISLSVLPSGLGSSALRLWG